MILTTIFGNQTAERIFLHLYHYGEIHARAIANDYEVSVTPIQNQLQKFEDASILVSKSVGRTRVYSLNPKSPYTNPIKELIRVAYETISLSEKEKVFGTRRRPRRKGKPVIKTTK